MRQFAAHLAEQQAHVRGGRQHAAAAALPFNFRGTGFQTADSKFVGYGFERWRLD
jgi:hypothetical protein